MATAFRVRVTTNRPNGSLTRALSHHIRIMQEMDDVDNVSLPTLKLLQTVNQSILAPALVNLQLSFMNTKFMFSDVTWNINIHLFESHVRVDHLRNESFASIPGHFGWQCSLLLRRPDMHLLSAKLRITSYRIPDPTNEAAWLNLVKPILEMDHQSNCTAIFNKPWERLPIAKDLVRFATNTVFLLGAEENSVVDAGGDSISHVRA